MGQDHVEYWNSKSLHHIKSRQNCNAPSFTPLGSFNCGHVSINAGVIHWAILTACAALEDVGHHLVRGHSWRCWSFHFWRPRFFGLFPMAVNLGLHTAMSVVLCQDWLSVTRRFNNTEESWRQLGSWRFLLLFYMLMMFLQRSQNIARHMFWLTWWSWNTSVSQKGSTIQQPLPNHFSVEVWTMWTPINYLHVSVFTVYNTIALTGHMIHMILILKYELNSTVRSWFGLAATFATVSGERWELKGYIFWCNASRGSTTMTKRSDIEARVRWKVPCLFVPCISGWRCLNPSWLRIKID